MPSPDPNDPGDDVGADTQMFRAFAEREEPAPPQRAVGAPFRILTLLAGLAVFAVIIWLLFRI